MDSNGSKKPRVSLKGLALAFLAAPFFLFAAYALLAATVYLKHSWMRADADGDGLSLIQDLDPDGDGLDLFSDPDADNDGVPNMGDAVGYALSMQGIPYDPLMGKLRNAGGKAGLVVCIDVPLRSYLRAGLSLPALLQKSAAEHPEWFEIDDGNTPVSPFFYRRVRNYYQLFKEHPLLLAASSPRPGDFAFYGKYHIALVVDVDDGTYRVVEASPLPGKMKVEISAGDYMEKSWGPPDFFGRFRHDEKEDGNGKSGVGQGLRP